MFLKDEAKMAIDSLELAKTKHETLSIETIKVCEERFALCNMIKDNVYPAFNELVTGLKAKLDVGEQTADIHMRLIQETNNLSNAVTKFDVETNDAKRKFEDVKAASVGATIGVGIGAGIATLGPTALMAYAATFGVASTGTLISSLSGAAATSASLAFLGLGSMATGELILGLAGPVGWAIAAGAVVGGGLYYRRKNKKVIEQAHSAEADVLKATASLELIKIMLVKEIELNAERVPAVLKHIDHIHKLVSENVAIDELVTELYTLETTISQLTIYLNKRIDLNPQE